MVVVVVVVVVLVVVVVVVDVVALPAVLRMPDSQPLLVRGVSTFQQISDIQIGF